MDYTKYFLPLWLHRPPFKNHTILLLLSCISLLYSSHGFHFHHPEILRLSNPSLPLPPPPPPPPSPAMSTSPTKSQTPISVVGAPLFLSLPLSHPSCLRPQQNPRPKLALLMLVVLRLRLENVRFRQKTKKKGEAGEWAKSKVGTVTFVKLVNLVRVEPSLTEFADFQIFNLIYILYMSWLVKSYDFLTANFYNISTSHIFTFQRIIIYYWWFSFYTFWKWSSRQEWNRR